MLFKNKSKIFKNRSFQTFVLYIDSPHSICSLRSLIHFIYIIVHYPSSGPLELGWDNPLPALFSHQGRRPVDLTRDIARDGIQSLPCAKPYAPF